MDFSRPHVTEIKNCVKGFASESYVQNCRPYFGISLKLTGASLYHIGERRLLLEPGGLILLPRGSRYETVRVEPGDYFICDITLDGDLGLTEPTIVTPTNPAELTRLFEEAERIWMFKKTAYYSRTMSLIYRILAELERESLGYYLESSRRELIREAGRYLESHISDPELSTAKLASVAGLSESHFRKLFTGVYKRSPGAYIASVRLERAKALLLAGECSVGEVAAQVGYSSIYYFSSAFRHAFGLSPSEFAASGGRT